jgi:beta-galactosidase
VVINYKLTNTVKIAWAPTRIYSIIPRGKTITILLYGAPGSLASIYFDVSTNVSIKRGKNNFTASAGGICLNASITKDTPECYTFEADGYRIEVITENDVLASHSWFIEAAGKTYVVIGPEYAGDLISKKKSVYLYTERPWEARVGQHTWVFEQGGLQSNQKFKASAVNHMKRLKIGSWQTKDASLAALPGYQDNSWLQSAQPLQMGADGNVSANAWYRATTKVEETGYYQLVFKSLHDRAALFLDGKRIDTGGIIHNVANLYLEAGINHTIAVFTAHDGRNKLIFRVGEIDTIDTKGLSGSVTLQKADGSGKKVTLTGWRMRGGPGDPNSSTGWKNLTLVNDKTKHPRFYRATFTLPVLKNTHTIWRVNTTSLSYGSVWVNSHNLGRYPEKIKINGMYIPECWLKSGINKLVVYDENGTGPERVSIQAETEASRDTQLLKFKLGPFSNELQIAELNKVNSINNKLKK